MNSAEAKVNAQIDLSRKLRERAAERESGNARKDPATELLEMRQRLNGQ
jgi:hypothetical protein